MAEAEPRWSHWPADRTPREAPIYALNELRIEAAPEVVWGWLVAAPLWPRWYSNSRDVEILSGPDPARLAAGTRFRWRTSNTLWRPVETTVDVCVAPHELGWGGAAMASRGYHSWLLTPTDGGCHVITEETQAGLLPSIGRGLLRRRLLTQHQRWLEGLAARARGGPPEQAPIGDPSAR